MTFNPNPILPGAQTQVTYTIGNFDRNFAAAALAFSHDLSTPRAMLIDSVLSNDCGGATVTGVGSQALDVSGGSLPAEQSCQIRLSLTSPGSASGGGAVFTTSTLTGDLGGSAVVAPASSESLFFYFMPVLTMAFSPSSVPAGASTDVQFTLTNTSPVSGLTDGTFRLPLGESWSPPASLNNFCGSGSIVSAPPTCPSPLSRLCYRRFSSQVLITISVLVV